jgi:hypothetical protein
LPQVGRKERIDAVHRRFDSAGAEASAHKKGRRWPETGKWRPCNQTSRELRPDASLRDERGSGVLTHEPWLTPANA